MKLKSVWNGSTEKGGGRGGGGEGGGGSSLPSDQNSPSNAGKGTNRVKIPKNPNKPNKFKPTKLTNPPIIIIIFFNIKNALDQKSPFHIVS